MAGGLARQEDVGRGPAAEADVGAAEALRLALDVADRPPAPDQLQLAQQRAEFAAGVLPDELARRPDDAAGFGRPALGAEVTQQAGAQRLRLADVDQVAVRVHHAVDAGTARAFLADAGLELAGAAAVHPAAAGDRRFQAAWAEAGESIGCE